MPAPKAPHAAKPIALLHGLLTLLLHSLLHTVLAYSLLLLPLPSTQPAWALGWPLQPRSEAGPKPARMLTPEPPAGRLQEVQPPVAVQQLQEALADRLPQIEILSPRDGTTLADGPWQLKLKVRDWPLADGGALGLGAHVVVQIDEQLPQRLGGSEQENRWQPASSSIERTLVIPQEPLKPGSHRVTVYAARPWGEAVKSPGAARQIRLHRLAANPQSLPAPGSAQLLPVSPAASNAGEPLLLDWLLLDAPLQNLRDGDGSWRLKVTINGDSFVVDQAIPLWLRGWKSGRNSLQLELVDGSGEPLNAPFNSFVQEIELAAPGSDAASARPRWQQGRLSADELAVLLGEEPPQQPDSEPGPTEAEPSVEPDPAATSQQPSPEAAPAPVAGDPAVSGATEPVLAEQSAREETPVGDGETAAAAAPANDAVPEPGASLENNSDDDASDTARPSPAQNAWTNSAEQDEQGQHPDQSTQQDRALSREPALSQEQEPIQEQGPVAEPEQVAEAETEEEQQPSQDQEQEQNQDQDQPSNDQPSYEPDSNPKPTQDEEATLQDQQNEEQNQNQDLGQELELGLPEVSANAQALESDVVESAHPEASEPLSPEQVLPLQITPPERISSSTPLGGSAREQVNPDGSLIQPAPRGPLAGLRQLLQSP